MSVSFRVCFLERMSTNLGAGPLGSCGYSYLHRMAWLPDRLLGTAPVKICGAFCNIAGYTGTGGGLVAIAIDKRMRFANQSNYPLTQNGDFSFLQTLANCVFQQTPSLFCTSPLQAIWPPLEYVPGQDAILLVVDGGPSGNPVLVNWGVTLEMDATPNWPDGMPDPLTAGGNDKHTVLLLHGTGQNGSPSFQDNSWRNYIVRYFGNARIQNNYYHFDGINSFVASELLPPGYGDDTDPTHNDWNLTGDFTLDLIANPSADATFGTVVSFGAAYGPFVVAQQGGSFYFFASSTGTTWNVSNGAGMGAAPLNTDTHLAIVRCANQIMLFNNGTQVGASITVTGPLFYPTWGRPTFGARAAIDNDGPTSITAESFFCGSMKEIRFSRVARWTANFAPPTAPYAP
jgi:hypothetical protein